MEESKFKKVGILFRRQPKKPKETNDLASDMDAIDVLPLSIIPLQTPGLRKARLVKNSNLQTGIELFKGEGTGSGQIDPKDLLDYFPSYAEEIKKDQEVLGKLSELKSFDVYTLRTSLKKLGISVEDNVNLNLSGDAKAALNSYMIEFTKPLIQQIYGKTDGPQSIDDLMQLFNNPDLSIARENLKLMAKKLKIELAEVPKFIEDYSDLFLSVAYFQNCYDGLESDVKVLGRWMDDIKTDRSLSTNKNLLAICERTKDSLFFIMDSLALRLDLFKETLEKFWSNINAKSFEKLKTDLAFRNTDIGDVLCGLVVKISLWKDKFPEESTVSPGRRSEFVISELAPGLNDLRTTEENARRRLNLV